MALPLAACGTPPEQGPGSAAQGPASQAGAVASMGDPTNASAPVQPQPKAWTDAFQEKAFTLAEVVRVEGPEGLLDHIVLRSDDELFERTQTTTAEGLLIRVTPKERFEVVRGYLDNWTLTANQAIEVLERPGMDAVEVTATGLAVWQDLNGGEQRADRLSWRGEVQ